MFPYVVKNKEGEKEGKEGWWEVPRDEDDYQSFKSDVDTTNP